MSMSDEHSIKMNKNLANDTITVALKLHLFCWASQWDSAGEIHKAQRKRPDLKTIRLIMILIKSAL